MDVELKPCPFCGSAAKMWKPEVGNGPDAAMCTNKDCDASVYFITPEHWNTRHGAGDAEDAARYRWLREQNTILDNPGAWTITRCDFTDEEDPSRYWVGSDLDAAIDAARAGERGVEGG